MKIKYLLLSLLLILFTVQYTNAENVLKILAIGNSFSEDAVEQYLYELGQSSGDSLVIGNAYIGGCSIDTHWDNTKSNKSDYSFRKIVGGKKTTLNNVTLENCITNEDWDIITFQQVSQNSGMYSTYTNLPNLLQYVKGKARNNQLRFAFHMTWAYAQNSNHSGFANYNNNQQTMYNAIVSTVGQIISSNNEIDILIPSGTAIQNGRTSLLGDTFCRDGYHLSYTVGRYTAACTWYETLTGKSVLENKYVPTTIGQEEALIAKKAAHYAALNYESVTPIDNNFYEGKNTTKLDSPIKISFGASVSHADWNNMSSPSSGIILNLKDVSGNPTEVTIAISDAFGDVNYVGPSSTNTIMNMPSDVSSSSFWGNGQGSFSGKTEPTSGFLLSHLNPDYDYIFHLFSSRTGANDNRETSFTIKGKSQIVYKINSTNNQTLVSTEKISSDENDEIEIRLEAGSNNNNSDKFYYINALMISAEGKQTDIGSVKEKATKLYPNPVTSRINLENIPSESVVDIYNFMGQKVLTDNMKNRDYIDVSATNIVPGCYILVIDQQRIPFVKK